jgi:hypothetical protein
MKIMEVVAAALLAWGGARTQCFAQDAPQTSWSDAQLDQMLGPIALYPDPLIALILPASTLPSQIVLANRYISQGGDPNQISEQPWDPSVQGLTHYPTVLQWMDDNLAWTTELGEAFASQQAAVMDSIQRLRTKAQALGNLPGTPQENVEDDNGVIDIDPADEDDIYVPDYEPDLIYDDPGVYCSFGVGFPIGGWLGFDWDWRHHHLISWGPGHPRPAGWWNQPLAARHNEIAANDSNLWRPRTRAGSVIIAGGNRGFQDRGFSSSFLAPRAVEPRAIAAPREAAPRVSVTTIGRAPAAPSFRSEPSESVFGGSQSAREVRESSFRGAESRGGGGFGGSRSGGSSNRR